MAANRMNREEFHAKVSPLDAEQLRKALWTLYWRAPRRCWSGSRTRCVLPTHRNARRRTCCRIRIRCSTT